MKVLDDEPDVAVTIEIVLEESGFFQVDLFHDGAWYIVSRNYY